MKIKFENIEKTLESSRMTGAALKISTTEMGAFECYSNTTTEGSVKLMNKVWGTPHTSVFEYINFDILIEDCSMLLELFIIEFRKISTTIKSRRYVDFRNQGFYMPAIECKKNKNKNEIHELNEKCKKYLEERFEIYSKLVDSGEKPEDARYTLPLSLNSNIILHLNAVELKRMAIEAISSDVAEIDEFGIELLSLSEEIFPGLFSRDVLDAEIKNSLNFKNVLKKIPEQFKSFDKNKTEPYKCVVSEFSGVSDAINKKLGYTIIDHEERESIKELMMNRKDKVMEFFSDSGSFYNDIHLSLSALTHLLRHRIQSVIVPCYSSIPDIKTSHIMEEDKKYSEAIAKEIEFLKFLKDNDVKNSSIIYFMSCGTVIPVAQYSNYRQLMHMSELRSCSRAQKEIRVITNKIVGNSLEKNKEFEGFFGPSCSKSGVCKEGRFSCKK